MFKTVNGGKIPTRGSRFSACVDLYANEDVCIGAGETKLVGLGVCLDIEQIKELIFPVIAPYENREIHIKENKTRLDNFMRSHYLQLELRSSLRAKGIIAGTGVIDIDFADELKIILHNMLDSSIKVCRDGFDDWGTYYIEKGDRIAQIMLKEHLSHLFGIETEKERDGGFGSTNSK